MNTTKHSPKYSFGTRVRFAPSPTGHLHIGGIRTALFNYLFALKNRGKFILRIDDTDKFRSSKKYEDSIINDLKWMGFEWDELYRQSERISGYEHCLNTLMEKGLAYECFCTEEDILKSKELAIRSKKPYIYDARCLHLSTSEIKTLRGQFKKRGVSPSIRLNIAKIGLNSVEFDDIVHGRIAFNPKIIGDFIIRTENNRFTYNFASAIDDSDLNITHIIRGEDHISNTPRQILLLKALDKNIPDFAHISLLYGNNGKIMSKRDAASNIDYYKNEGYLPNAILNCLAITGNTFIHTKNAEKELFSSLSEMASHFDITRTKGSSAIFDEKKLRFINEKWLVNTPAAELMDIITEKFNRLDKGDVYIKSTDTPNESGGSQDKNSSAITQLKESYSADTSLEIIEFLKKEFKTLKEILCELKIFLDDFKVDTKNIEGNGNNKYSMEELRALSGLLLKNLTKTIDFNETSIKNAIKETVKESGKTAGDCYKTLRLCLTGKLDGPSIIKTSALLGKQRSLARLDLN